MLTSIEQLLSLNGWVAALCPTLTRPFGQNRASDAYDALIEANHLYFIPIVIHSADHFLVDQLAVIVQLAKTLGTHNLFVSMLDYASTDSTETLVDLCEAVLILLGVPFRIRRVPAMTEDPLAAYYPAEEAHMRNLALEPLLELYQKRKLRFHRVIWLKGFTCPNDILETIKVSLVNEAAMVCGMDWSEHNGFYIFSDRYVHVPRSVIRHPPFSSSSPRRWRTRDILGDQFRQAKSSSKPDAGPPRDPVGAERYAKHLPFQVFCCESGTHVVDPAQSYYAGIGYRHGSDFYNATADAGVSAPPEREQDAPCLDSTQAWFCRDMWAHKASEGLRHAAPTPARRRAKRAAAPALVARQVDDEDQDVGADYDAMPENANMPEPAPLSDEELGASEPGYVPNVDFEPARILVNPRCVTTYAGVSHTQLALDLFGQDIRDEPQEGGASVTQYRLDSWQGAPESFVCQEQK